MLQGGEIGHPLLPQGRLCRIVYVEFRAFPSTH
jgi:hypothetical protein